MGGQGSCSRHAVLPPHACPLQEATLLPEEEQQGLATSLDNWRGAVQSAVATAALQLRVAEQQAVAAVGRCAGWPWARESRRPAAVWHCDLSCV